MHKLHRRSIRLPRFDYSSPGAYFVTICAHHKECIFGDVENGDVVLNEIGEMVRNRLLASADMCSEIEIDEFMIMPNHLHLIVWIVRACATRPCIKRPRELSNMDRGAWHAPVRKPRSLSSFVGLFKSKTTSIYRKISNDSDSALWQRNYYERVIRNENELFAIRKYIIENPLKWENDPEKPLLYGRVPHAHVPTSPKHTGE